MAKKSAPQVEEISEDLVGQELELNDENVTEQEPEFNIPAVDPNNPHTQGAPCRDFGKSRN
jgi:hypothetical protein